MKLKIFYSWQSDLPNTTNRSYIQKCLNKAMRGIHTNNKNISEWTLESDTRGETGTPELASTIFTKIDNCDIFICDISIINAEAQLRKTCNPNVLVELGYASSKLGWDRILCIFNLNYGKIEELPFDIRHRAPISYKLEDDILTTKLAYKIQEIIDNKISNKKYVTSIKREIDLSLQAALIDICKLIYFKERPKCYNYNLILHNSYEELSKELSEKDLLGFQLFKNNTNDLDKFIALYNNQVYLNFLNSEEKNSLAKIILQFKDFINIIHNPDFYDKGAEKKEYKIINAHKMNETNPKDSYILLQKIDKEKSIVIDSGSFSNSELSNLLFSYKIKSDAQKVVINKILDLSFEINEWIRISGNYFIYNERLLSER